MDCINFIDLLILVKLYSNAYVFSVVSNVIWSIGKCLMWITMTSIGLIIKNVCFVIYTNYVNLYMYMDTLWFIVSETSEFVYIPIFQFVCLYIDVYNNTGIYRTIKILISGQKHLVELSHFPHFE